MIKLFCIQCSKDFEVDNRRKETAKFCSHKCQGEFNKKTKFIKCLNCGKEKEIANYQKHKYCSIKCQMEFEYSSGIRDKNEITKKAHEALKKRSVEQFKTNPKIFIDHYGYRIIFVPEIGNIKEHRYIWEKHFGPIPIGMHIHHKNGIRDDNRIENLQMLTKSQHHKLEYSTLKINSKGKICKD